MLSTCAVLWLTSVLSAPAAGDGQSPSEPITTPTRAIELLDDAIQSIHSFDVHLTIDCRVFARADRPEARFSRTFRQSFENGKSRFELTEGQSSQNGYTMVFDGKTKRVLHASFRRAWVAPPPENFVEEGQDYLTYFRNYYGPSSLAELLRDRENNTIRQSHHSTYGELLWIDSPAQTKFVPYRNTAILVALDPRHGWLPRIVDSRVSATTGSCLVRTSAPGQVRLSDRKPQMTAAELARRAMALTPEVAALASMLYRLQEDDTILRCRMEVLRFGKIPGGGWAPVEVAYSYYGINSQSTTFKKCLGVITATVDPQQSSWNRPLPKGTFELTFPPGTFVTDFTQQLK